MLVITHTFRQNPIPDRFWRVFPAFHAAIRPKAPPSRLEPTRTASIQFETSSLGIHPKKFQIGWRSFSPRKALQTVWFSVKAVYGCGVQTITEGGNLRFLGVGGLLPSFHRVQSGTTSNGFFLVKALYGCGVQRFTEVHVQLDSHHTVFETD